MSDDTLLRNSVSILGKGARPMLFTNGFGCDKDMWRFITPAFEADYKIVLFNYTGIGGPMPDGWDAEKYSGLGGYAQDTIDVVEGLDLRNVILVGHSVGAMIGVLASIARPDRFSKLILIGPSPCYLNDGDYHGGFDRADLEGLLDLMDNNYIGWASYLAPVIMKNEDRPELTEELRSRFCSVEPEAARIFAEATFFADNRADLMKVNLPSLIMQCSNDSIAPVFVGHYLHAHLTSSTFAQMKATGHCPQLSHPEEIIHMIKTYLYG
jgi:sigma-B regulation protein RsbQ